MTRPRRAPRIRPLLGHDGAVNDCAFGPGGTRLVSAGEDGTVRLWSTGSGEQEAVLGGHTGAVLGCAFGPDGTVVASAGGDGRVHLWDARTGDRSGTLIQEGAVHGCAFRPDGRLLATAGEDETVRLWDPRNGAPVSVLTGHEAIVWSCAFGAEGATLVSAGEDRVVKIWDVERGRARLEVLTGCTGGRYRCAVAPDGALVAAPTGDGFRIGVWDCGTGREVASLAGHTEAPVDVAFSPDGALLASVGWDGSVRVWDPSAGAPVAIVHTAAAGLA
ncbi:MAG: WD40 repeat domain-containing protein, partial [Acidimicrobiales bacterium]|nr:WD40 repeat domain-containing protein [Acidimicrobiales bacterium]